MRPDISVIIAAYNVEHYIARAIESAVTQDGVAVEVLVINDGSTDNTAAVVTQHNNPHVRLFGHTANRGPGAARNVGLAMAAAPWVAVLDGDDVFAPGRLARCLARAKAQEADVVVDNLKTRHEEDGHTAPMFPPDYFARMETLDLKTFIDGNRSFLGGPALGYLKPIFSTKFLREHKLRYDTELRIGEDYLLLAEALACGAKCVVDPEAGYIYTVRAGSTSHRLALADVERIRRGDEIFLNRYELGRETARAQKRRTAALNDAFAFTNIVNALKGRDIGRGVKSALTRPASLRHLWRPLSARMKKVSGRPRN